MVLFAQSDDQGAGGGFFGLVARAGAGGEEESRLRVVAEAVAQDAEGAWGIAESVSDLVGGAALDEIGAQGFILAVLGQGGFKEEGTRVR